MNFSKYMIPKTKNNQNFQAYSLIATANKLIIFVYSRKCTTLVIGNINSTTTHEQELRITVWHAFVYVSCSNEEPFYIFLSFFSKNKNKRKVNRYLHCHCPIKVILVSEFQANGMCSVENEKRHQCKVCTKRISHQMHAYKRAKKKS